MPLAAPAGAVLAEAAQVTPLEGLQEMEAALEVAELGAARARPAP